MILIKLWSALVTPDGTYLGVISEFLKSDKKHTFKVLQPYNKTLSQVSCDNIKQVGENLFEVS